MGYSYIQIIEEKLPGTWKTGFELHIVVLILIIWSLFKLFPPQKILVKTNKLNSFEYLIEIFCKLKLCKF